MQKIIVLSQKCDFVYFNRCVVNNKIVVSNKLRRSGRSKITIATVTDYLGFIKPVSHRLGVVTYSLKFNFKELRFV